MQSAIGNPLEEEQPVDSCVRLTAVRNLPAVLCALDGGELPASESWGGKPVRPRNTNAALKLVNSTGHDVRCAIVHPEFHRGAGLRLVAHLREVRPLMPILLCIDRVDRNLLSLAYCQGLEIASGVEIEPRIGDFVQASLARPRTTKEQLEVRLAELAKRHALTPTETRIAVAAVQGMTRAQLLSSFDVSVNTLKSQTRSILKKTGHTSLNDLCRVVLTSVLAGAD